MRLKLCFRPRSIKIRRYCGITCPILGFRAVPLGARPATATGAGSQSGIVPFSRVHHSLPPTPNPNPHTQHSRCEHSCTEPDSPTTLPGTRSVYKPCDDRPPFLRVCSLQSLSCAALTTALESPSSPRCCPSTALQTATPRRAQQRTFFFSTHGGRPGSPLSGMRTSTSTLCLDHFSWISQLMSTHARCVENGC